MDIYEKINVCQVGYLQELNRDTRSTEHEKLSPETVKTNQAVASSI
jgi:hypothetical protein